MIQELAQLHKCFVEVRDGCGRYAFDMDTLRMSAARLAVAAEKAGREAGALNADDMAKQFQGLAETIKGTRDKLVELHAAAAGLARGIAQTTRDFEIAARKIKTE